jgi:hypothetical protein
MSIDRLATRSAVPDIRISEALIRLIKQSPDALTIVVGRNRR